MTPTTHYSPTTAKSISGPNLPCRSRRTLYALIALLEANVAGQIHAQAAPRDPAISAATAGPTAALDAWWTGPVSASSANTLPRGHVLVESYLFDVRSRRSDYIGSLSYLLYGLTDDLTVGAIPTFGGTRASRSRRARRIGINDLTLTGQYRVRRAAEGSRLPAISLVVQHTLPLGRFDRLGGHPDLGIGSGAHATLVGIYVQRIDRLANGRPLRTRINITRSVAWRGSVQNESVFGTPREFTGSARAGGVSTVDTSLEYSVSRNWVLAADFVGRWSGRGTVAGNVGSAPAPWTATIRSSASFSVSPAIEYSWSSTRGVLLGVRFTPEGRNAGASITPIVAVNAVF